MRRSGTAPETSRNIFSIRQGTNEDDSQSNLHPEAVIFNNQMKPNSGPEDGHDLVTGATEQIRDRHDMTGVHEEVTYCSPSTSSGNRKRSVLPVNRNSAVKTLLRRLKQTKFCWLFSSWQIPTSLQISITILMEFPNCWSHSRKRCPRSTGNPKSSSCLKIVSKRASKSIFNWLKRTESTTSILSWGETPYKHLKTLKALPERIWENFWQFVWRKYVKPQSMATAKHKFQKLVLNPANQKLVDFLEELQKLAKNAFEIVAHAIIKQFIYAKMPPHLKKSINQAHLENSTYEQIVTHLEKELELNGLEAPDEIQIFTVSHKTANANAGRPKPTCHHCKKPGHYRT